MTSGVNAANGISTDWRRPPASHKNLKKQLGRLEIQVLVIYHVRGSAEICAVTPSSQHTYKQAGIEYHMIR